MGKKKILFEVKGYSDLDAYERRDGVILAEFISKKKAVKIAKKQEGEYHIYKVQSMDREEIYIFIEGECDYFPEPLSAVDSDLEYFIDEICPSVNDVGIWGIHEEYDGLLDILMNRYDLVDDDGYLEEKLKTILKAQRKAKVKY